MATENINELTEDEILDKLIEDNLEEFEHTSLKKLRDSAFRNKDKLKQCAIPNLSTMGSDAFMNCNNLNSFSSNQLTSLSNNAFYNCPRLSEINCPKITTIGPGAFVYCLSLHDIDLDNITNFGQSAFTLSGLTHAHFIKNNITFSQQCFTNASLLNTVEINNKSIASIPYDAFSYTPLYHLILHSTTLVPLYNTGAFQQTPIEQGWGWIYVPANLRESYKSATNWSTFSDRIVALEEYPKAIITDSTITEENTWEVLFDHLDHNTHTTTYALGDTIDVKINNIVWPMEIVALEEDHIDFISKYVWPSEMPADNNFNGTYFADAFLSQWLNNDFYDLIESQVQQRIVKKVNISGSNKINYTSEDYIWIPSAREMCGAGANWSEDDGEIYHYYSDNINNRIKYRLGASSAHSYRLRTMNSNGNTVKISASGYINGADDLGTSSGLIFGFRIK